MTEIIAKLTSGELFFLLAVIIIGIFWSASYMVDSITRIWRKQEFEPADDGETAAEREEDTDSV